MKEALFQAPEWGLKIIETKLFSPAWGSMSQQQTLRKQIVSV